jgi:hypothetical protein
MEGVVRAMFMTKLKAATVFVAASLVVAGTGLASYRSLAADEDPAARVERIKRQIAGLEQELRQAEDAAARDTPSDPQAPVAVIFGDVPITRAELGEHLVRRATREQLDQYVNRRILEHACGEKGITVSDREVSTALAAEVACFDGGQKAFNVALRHYQKTLAEWKDDVIRPRLLLAKLCRDRIHVTEQDVRNAYQAAYGEKVECQVIVFPRDQRTQAERVLERIREDAAAFELQARTQPNGKLAATNGRLPPIGRHSTGNEALERVAFGLRPGEVGPLIDTPEGFVIVKCLGWKPASTGPGLEEVREVLKRELRDRRVANEGQKLFQELRKRARPRLLWKPSA